VDGLGFALEELRGPLELYSPFFSEKIYTALQEYSVLGRMELVQAGIAESASSLELRMLRPLSGVIKASKTTAKLSIAGARSSG